MPTRRTIRAPARIAGPALFSGVDSALTVRPATPGTGVVLRTELAETPATIASLSHHPAHPAFQGHRPRCTTLHAGRPVAMVEHALAALSGLGITDAVLETDAPELPIDDGSSSAIVRAVLDAGVVEFPEPIEPIRLAHAVEVRVGDTFVIAEPSDTIDYAYALDYGGDSPIPTARARWTGDPDDFARSVAPARTFCTRHEAEQMRSLGMFDRFTPRDLLVIGPEGPIDNAWRYPDEAARHKLLDLIGDLALLGRPLIARVSAVRTGHADTHELCRRILASI